jgi:hypothetical protein
MNGYKDANGQKIGVFGTNESVNHAEISKAIVNAIGINPKYSGCSGAPKEQWYSAYMDSLCDNGLINKNWNAEASGNVNSREAYRLARDAGIWRKKHQSDTK